MTKGRNFILGFVALSAGLLGLGGAFAAPVSDAEFKSVIAADLKFLQDKLADPAVAKKAKASLKSSAVIIAQLAQSRMADAKADKMVLATIRDEAIKIVAAVKANEFDKAKEIAAGIKTDMKADPAAKTEIVVLLKNGEGVHGFDLAELMAPYRKEKANGRGFEDAVRVHAKKITPGESLILAARLAAIAELTESNGPNGEGGKKTKALWTKYSQDNLTSATDAVKALTGKVDEAKAKAAFKKIDDSCKNCHNVFRDD